MSDVDTGPALVSMAQQFSGLPMRSLIGGPLTAAAQANSMMAVTQTKFMMDTCFNKTTAEGKDKVEDDGDDDGFDDNDQSMMDMVTSRQ